MKVITLPKTEKIPAKELIATVCGQAQAGATVDQIRRRIRLIDALDASTGDRLSIEDADFDFLREIFPAFKFGLAHHDILTVADAIEAAEATGNVDPPRGARPAILDQQIDRSLPPGVVHPAKS